MKRRKKQNRICCTLCSLLLSELYLAVSVFIFTCASSLLLKCMRTTVNVFLHRDRESKKNLREQKKSSCNTTKLFWWHTTTKQMFIVVFSYLFIPFAVPAFTFYLFLLIAYRYGYLLFIILSIVKIDGFFKY